MRDTVNQESKQRKTRKSYSMRIPHTQLSSAVLRAVVEEFVTRDGTDHSAVERRVEKVLRQLHAGQVELHFDRETQTCNILSVEENPPDGARGGDGPDRCLPKDPDGYGDSS
jgi:uncharacterized protein YheU (UPF0270 family)